MIGLSSKLKDAMDEDIFYFKIAVNLKFEGMFHGHYGVLVAHKKERIKGHPMNLLLIIYSAKACFSKELVHCWILCLNQSLFQLLNCEFYL